MKPVATLILLASLFGLAACEDPAPTTYPLSGEPCAADDPVQEMDIGDCAPPSP
ncbi:hypothetical protein [Thetidibacter halocola]|uniref:Lipoprotein n=1 Tax=Thetidibacter halocola TaxID=2827239 RepID=A0A8J7WFX1_9RHOB|nr:hypothetical protein [Thetidibacter halocola]MBS0124583.1 hypothetical protein [Thetidibacter halocola]